MEPRTYLEVDPRSLYLPTSRLAGADPGKLQRQIARYGRGPIGMPPLLVYRASDGNFQLYDGVTRAIRVAKLLPGTLVTVELIDDFPGPVAHLPTVGERLP